MALAAASLVCPRARNILGLCFFLGVFLSFRQGLFPPFPQAAKPNPSIHNASVRAAHAQSAWQGIDAAIASSLPGTASDPAHPAFPHPPCRALFNALFTFPEEYKHMLKERASGMYRCGPAGVVQKARVHSQG